MNEPIEQRYELWDQFLARFLQSKGKSVSLKADYSSLYTELMTLRAGQDLLDFGDLVWKEGSLLQS